MRLSGPVSVSSPARLLLEVLIGLVGISVGLEVIVVAGLLANPLHPIREHFRVTTIVAVPAKVWRTEDLARIVPGTASVEVDPWAYLTYQPTSRVFVLATAAVSLSAWACILLALLNLRRAFTNIEGGTPFPRDNVRRIRRAGLAILGYAAVQLIIDAAMAIYMRATTTIAGRPPVIPWDILFVDFPLGAILAGLALVVFAEIFRAGAELQDDQALTV